MPANIVVLGAGVSGLTTALLLVRDGKHKVTIIAKHMPGDHDIEYASPWAGANYTPFSIQGTPARQYERDTWVDLYRLAKDIPEAGVHFQDSYLYRRAQDAVSDLGPWFSEDAWFKNVVPDFRVISKDELPPGMGGATSFTSVCINTALYLPWLLSQCLKHGVVVKRGIVDHVSSAASLHHTGKPADLVVNCTGLSSLHLGGVEDKTLHPVRGQVVVVRNEPALMASVSGTDDRSGEVCYVMDRAAGGGAVLGGCTQLDNWESQPDHSLAVRIMKRAVALVPSLVPPGAGIEALSIIRHGVGLRPLREGGIRVEAQVIGGVAVVHNYGHGGYGYQTSYGSARAAAKLVEAALDSRAKL